MSDATKLPTWFWVVSGIALVWNLMGVMAYLGQATMGPEDFAQMSDAKRELFENIPAWVTGAFAIAVFGGLAGSIGLLLRKAWAGIAFMASLAGVGLQQIHNFFLSNAVEVMGAEAIVGPVIVIIGAVALVWFSNMVKGKGWLT